MDYVIKRANTTPAFTATIVDSTGAVVNLTGATVNFVARALTSTNPAVNAAATIVSPSAGTVSYTPTATDTNVAGVYMCEWPYTLASGAKGTFPPDGWLELNIEEDLATPGGARLVTLGEVKDHLRFADSNRTRDARLERMIDSVAPVIEFITGPILQRLYQNETYDGGQWFISLRHRPVLEVHQVTEYRGPIPYPLTQVPTPDLGTIYSYMFEPPGRIVRRTVGGGITPFPPGADQVFVTYTGGFASTPLNVREAVLELIRIRYDAEEQPGPSDDRRGERVMGFYVPNEVREMLEPNKRHPSVA